MMDAHETHEYVTKGSAMNEINRLVSDGDVIEFTLRAERRTAEVMLVSEDDVVLLDLFDGDRPAWARLAQLEDVAIYRPELAEVFAAAKKSPRSLEDSLTRRCLGWTWRPCGFAATAST